MESAHAGMAQELLGKRQLNLKQLTIRSASGQMEIGRCYLIKIFKSMAEKLEG